MGGTMLNSQKCDQTWKQRFIQAELVDKPSPIDATSSGSVRKARLLHDIISRCKSNLEHSKAESPRDGLMASLQQVRFPSISVV
jgi:hypothetical protein